jgi:tRNA dimethylallyltransferase
MGPILTRQTDDTTPGHDFASLAGHFAHRRRCARPARRWESGRTGQTRELSRAASGENVSVIVAVVGPTAAGKSSLALRLALELTGAGRPAEIISADSMLLYRGMDIGTAKPTPAERTLVPHHLIDVLDVTQSATVAEFQGWARDALTDCKHRCVVPILVGGSALYVRAVLDDFQFPGTDPALRAGLEAELADLGPEALHARLDELDPVAAAAILPGNGRRVIRALEVISLTGGLFSASLPERRYLLPDVCQVGIDIDRAALDARIAARVHSMWAAGFVTEVERLAGQGLRDGLTASRALGYAQILRFLDGELSEEQAQAETISRTRKFARRQDSWFRRDQRITWFDARRDDLVAAVRAHLRMSDA